MKITSKNASFIGGVIASLLLSIGLFRASSWFDPIMPERDDHKEPSQMAGPIKACHLIEKPADKVG